VRREVDREECGAVFLLSRGKKGVKEGPGSGKKANVLPVRETVPPRGEATSVFQCKEGKNGKLGGKVSKLP